jgi:hypothetical protein
VSPTYRAKDHQPLKGAINTIGLSDTALKLLRITMGFCFMGQTTMATASVTKLPIAITLYSTNWYLVKAGVEEAMSWFKAII